MADVRQPARRGRPRDATIDARVVDATRDLLAAVGFSATTIQAISTRSGVPASAIYRRWSTRIALIEDAVAPAVPTSSLATGDLERDLHAFVASLRAALTTPAARAAVPALLSAYHEGHRGRPPEEWLPHSWRPPLYEILHAASPHEVDPDVDPDDVFDVLLGAVLVEAFVPTATRRNTRELDLVELLRRIVRPQPTTPQSWRSTPR